MYEDTNEDGFPVIFTDGWDEEPPVLATADEAAQPSPDFYMLWVNDDSDYACWCPDCMESAKSSGIAGTWTEGHGSMACDICGAKPRKPLFYGWWDC